ncbi:hypothetical protein KNE206_66660 [Kitasatospora sp. NE20-6]
MEPADTRAPGTAVGPRGPGADAAARPARGAEREIAGRLSGQVLGAGMLVMPPVVAVLAGGDGLLVWSAHLLLGGSVSLLLALLVRAGMRSASLADTVGALLGPWARRTVDGAFALAFTLGQAAIAWFAATCLETAADGGVPRPGAGGLLLALGILAVAVLAALSPLTLPAAVLRLRPWAAGAVALACAAYGWPAVAAGPHTPLAPSGLSPDGARWLALMALFFAGVGWEAVTGIVPATTAGPRRTAVGVALGTASVAAVCLGLALVEHLGVEGSAVGRDAVPAPVRWVLAIATAAVLTCYCFTNVRTAARIASRLRRGGPGSPDQGPAKAVVAAVGVACCVFATAGATGDGAVPLLLLGPAAAALIGYALAAAAAVRRGGALMRCAGAALLVVLVLVSTVVPTAAGLLGG